MVPDWNTEHQAYKAVPIEIVGSVMRAWSKSLDTFSNFKPNFETIVSSIQINTGYDFRDSGIRCRAILAVTFIKPEQSTLA